MGNMGGGGVECDHMAEDSGMWHLIPAHLVCSFLLCPVVLNAPDTVLIERNVGKRIDPVTGGTTPPEGFKDWERMPLSHCLL